MEYHIMDVLGMRRILAKFELENRGNSGMIYSTAFIELLNRSDYA